MNSQEFKEKVTTLIDDLKGVCANYGLGNDGNEFKIITQVFLYKFLNDKFAYEVKKVDSAVAAADSWEDALRQKSKSDYQKLFMRLGPDTAKLMPEHFLATLYNQQTEPDFSKSMDEVLLDIATINTEIFSVKTADGQKVVLFDRITEYVSSKRDDFARAIINKLINCSFEQIFSEKFDFYSTIFEYLIKDYNKDSGGKYAEYYTPHSVAKIMASCLVTDEVQNVSCYDPSAGSGTLLMNLAHAIGEDRCTIYTEDISQKSSHLLRLNLILNNLVHSIPNVVQGNTILEPYHRDGSTLKQFDYIVSNPPFKLDFSDWRDDLDTTANKERFFAGIPNILKKDKAKMAIYLLFIQHIIHSLKPEGKAAIVVPTGFITAQSGIPKRIRKHLVEKKMLAGVVSMPSNIFATTGTNVSILFIDGSNEEGVVLIDASGLGYTVKESGNQKTVLEEKEEALIVSTFNQKDAVEDFSVVVSYDDFEAKNYSLSAGQYFEIKIPYIEISPEEFADKRTELTKSLTVLFETSRELESELIKQLASLKYE